MPVDSDYLYDALLAHNYLPMVKEHRDETPSLFSTETFSAAAGDEIAGLFAAFGDRHVRRRDGFDQIEYRTTRFNNVARLMHIPHPMPYAVLCQQLRDSWGEPTLNRICNSPNSKVKPEQHEDGRLFKSDEYEDRPTGRVVVMGREDGVTEATSLLKQTVGMFYFVEADISSCFPSIYSHALSWALVGHDFAKQHRGFRHDGLWFNQIDKRQRTLKRCETLGVPVGPATSNIACEVVLYPVDEALRAKGYIFTRHIDDFRCYCETREKAEAFVRDLEKELSRYLLGLNAKKVKIEPLPRSGVAPWVLDVRHRLPLGRWASGRQVVDCLDYAVSLNRLEPDGSVVKYAVRALSGKLFPDSRKVFAHYATNLAVHVPVVLPILCDAAARPGCEFDAGHLSILLRRHVEYRRSDAVGWTVCLHGLAGVPVALADAQAIVDSRDCMSMAALLALGQHVDLVKAFVGTLAPTDHYLLDQYWLLIHELSRLNELPAGGALDGYRAETGLDSLANNDVTFLRSIEEVKAIGRRIQVEEDNEDDHDDEPPRDDGPIDENVPF